jgi:hypothetical protein
MEGVMTAQEMKSLRYRTIEKRVVQVNLYTLEELQKALFALGHPVPKDDLYIALKATGWIKLRLIRDRLLETKRDFPKREPFSAMRHIIKWPLLVKRHEDLPEYSISEH